MAVAARRLPGIGLCDDPYVAAADADAVLVLTDWSEIRFLDLERLAQVMSGDLLAGYRNLFAPETVLSAGLRHVSIGRPDLGQEIAAGTTRIATHASTARAASSNL